MKDLTISINLPIKDALRVIDFLSGAPVAVAPVASVAVAPVAVAPEHDPQIGVGLDASGSPWNPECHSDSKGKDESGFWKGRRGCTKEKRAAIEAQDRARLAGTPVPVAGPDPVPVAAPIAVPAPVTMGFPTLTPPVAVIPVAPAPVTYEALMAKWGELSASNRITIEMFQQFCAKHGITNTNDLATNETMRANIMSEFAVL